MPYVLDWKASIEKLKSLLSQLENFAVPDEDKLSLMVRKIFWLLLNAQLQALQSLNDRYISCAVSWDDKTGLPSHPSMIADARYSAERIPDSFIRNLIDSFVGWTSFAEQEMNCWCGSWNKPRVVKIEVFLNHILSVEGECLRLKQFVGLKYADQKHLKHHYDLQMPSVALNGLVLVSCFEASLKMINGVEIKCLSVKKAKTLNLEGVGERIVGANKTLVG